MNKNLISTGELKESDIDALLSLAIRGKASHWKEFSQALASKVIGLLFFDPSLRTRASFQAGIARLGGTAVVINADSDSWKLEFSPKSIMNGDCVEHVKEAAGVLSRYFDALGVRSFPKMVTWEEDQKDTVLSCFQQFASIPLFNMESSLWHPCQALADAMTIKEQLGDTLHKKKFVLSWANHPKQLPMAVPNSAALIAAQLGLSVHIACPEGYDLAQQQLDLIKSHCTKHGSSFELSHSQPEAFIDADIVYAKSWTPPPYVGQKQLELSLRQKLSSWIVNENLMKLTNNAIFMHCLPVRRNVVVSDAVLDGKRSVIFDQAANRLHVQNAWLISTLHKE